MKRLRYNWVFTKLYRDGKKEVVKIPVKDYNKDFAKEYSDKVFNEENNCNVVYAYYVKKLLFSSRYYMMDMDKNFCFNRSGLNF